MVWQVLCAEMFKEIKKTKIKGTSFRVLEGKVCFIVDLFVFDCASILLETINHDFL
jgi:hypothetical protein